MLAETGMPFIDIFPVKELIKNEYPDPKKLKNLIKVLSIGQVKLDEPHIIEFKHKYVMNIIFNHMRFPRLSGTGIIPLKLKSKLYYDER